MTASSPPTSLPAVGTVLHGVPVVPGVQYAPVIRPGRPPAVDVAKQPDIAETDRPAEAARFAAAATAVANRLRGITELLEMDLDDPDQRLALQLACRARLLE